MLYKFTKTTIHVKIEIVSTYYLMALKNQNTFLFQYSSIA